jgi:hypothetical protein
MLQCAGLVCIYLEQSNVKVNGLHRYRRISFEIYEHEFQITANTIHKGGHAVAQWLRHYATNRKVADSKTDEVTFLNLPNHSGRTTPWGLLNL